jgi:Ran GTPase-activating protein (RanGAP) involved in mRNA processing and transport
LESLLWTNRSLLALSLWGSRIGDEGVVAVARGLSKSHSLLSLDLGWNLISDRGIVAVADALAENLTLKVSLWPLAI